MTSSEAVSYLDSSAIVKLLIEEAETYELRKLLASYPERVSSKLARVEVLRTVRRRDPSRQPLARALLDRIALVDIDGPILDGAASLEPDSVRALDAIHLATALNFISDDPIFVSYDRVQIKAAEGMGLQVVCPGA